MYQKNYIKNLFKLGIVIEFLNLVLNFIIIYLFNCYITMALFVVNLVIEIVLFYFYLIKMDLSKNKISFVLILLSIQCLFQIDILLREKMVVETKNYVAHAGGGINENGKIYRYLNCQETFQDCIDKGIRIIEYDVIFSLDGFPIFTHDFEYMKEYSMINRPTYDEYCNYKILGKYTPVTIDFIFEKMSQVQDLVVMFDCKEKDIFTLYDCIDDIALGYGQSILDRVMPQVYDSETYFKCEENLKFNRYAFSNYKSYYGTNKLKTFIANADKIDVVIMSTQNKKDINLKKLKDLNKVFAVHTINDKLVANYHFSTSIGLVFTDCLF